MIDAHQNFREICCLHNEGETVKQAKTSRTQVQQTVQNARLQMNCSTAN
jgi:hypothetical protein